MSMSESKSAAPALRLLRACLASVLLAAAVPASAFHFPWDQGHDTTQSKDPNAPGPDDRPPCDGDCNGKSKGSPAYAALGHAYWTETDLVLRGRPYMGVYRAYNSNDPVLGLFGNGWSVDFDIALYPANNSGVQQRIYKAANGKRFIFVKQADGSYKAPDSRFETITEGASTVTMTMLDGRRNVFANDGRLLERYDTNGNRISFSYDSFARPVSMTDGNGRSLAIAYNGSGLVSTVTDHTGRSWRYGYDASGNLTDVTDPAGGARQYTWQAYRPAGDAATYSQLLSVTDASGVAVIRYTYAAEKVASYTEGENVITYTRTTSNTKLAGTVTRRDSVGATSSFTYGALGLITREVDGIGGATSYTFDANGRITATTDALNRVWSSSYDSQGRVTASSNPLGQSSGLQYSGNDPRPVRITSPSGRVVVMSYDAKGNPLTTTDPSGAITRMGYNAQGDMTSITNALSQQTVMAYSATGLPMQVTDSLGRSRRMSYDGLGRVIATTNAAGETTGYAYDDLDRVTSVTDPLGQNTSFAYDAAGRLLSVTDAKGARTQTEYDSFGRISAEVAPDGRRTTYAYRTDNLLANISWSGGNISYQYDANKRVIRETAGSEVITFSYNALNQLTGASGPGGSISYTYDNAGRVLTETSGGKTHTSTRNAEGERIRLDYLGQSQAYARDDRGLVNRITAIAGNFDFGFDALGRRTRLTYPNGSTASYAYDAAGQLTNLTHSGVFNAPYAHSYDAAGRITRITGDSADWNYSYDAVGRLIQATQGANIYAYTLDPVGNILDGGRNYDVNHRLTSDASKDYSYDARGNLTFERDRSTGERTAYSWNAKNQLLKIEFFANAGATTAARTLSYTYDPLGRRASKTDNGSVQRFTYDGDDLLGTLDSTGAVIATTVFSGAVDEPLATTTGGSAKLLYSNHLRSIKAVSDGALLTHAYGYGPYGETLAGGSADSVSFRYAGREKDADNLYYYRARYYDNSSKRFLSADPIGVFGGVNSYAYVEGNPISNIDPEGKFVNVVLGGLLGGGLDLGIQLWQNGGRFECVSWGQVGLSAALGAATSGLAAEGILARGGIKTVTHWGPEGMSAIRTGDWVMTGSGSVRNWLLSGVPERGYGLGSAVSTQVPAGSLSWPSGWEFIKGFWGQRIYNGATTAAAASTGGAVDAGVIGVGGLTGAANAAATGGVGASCGCGR